MIWLAYPFFLNKTTFGNIRYSFLYSFNFQNMVNQKLPWTKFGRALRSREQLLKIYNCVTIG
jgi:hypothetical protein